MLQVSVHPGAVLAFNFLVFNLILGSLLDWILSRVLSIFYHMRISSGRPINVRTADMPGITTFILENRLWPSNLIALFFKLSFIVLLLYIDLNVIGDVGVSVKPHRRYGTFDFDPSTSAWPFNVRKDLTRTVSRNWATIRSCRLLDNQRGPGISYYSLAFNLSDGVVLKDELAPVGTPVAPVDESSQVCLDPASVQSPRVVARVRGCSWLHPPLVQLPEREQRQEKGTLKRGKSRRTGEMTSIRQSRLTEQTKVRCEENSSIVAKLDLPFNDSFRYTALASASIGLFTFNVSVWGSTIQAYATPSSMLTCFINEYGLKTNGLISRNFYCIFVVHKNNSTLIEAWRYDQKRQLLSRTFAGPVFDGIIEIGVFPRLHILFFSLQEQNWVTFSSLVVSAGMVYRYRPDTLLLRESTHIVTTIPLAVVIVAVSMTVAIITASVIVTLTVGRDTRPQFNTIDGLSSILREEKLITGCSTIHGDPAYVGFCFRKNGELQFGPLKTPEQSIRPIKDVDIV